MQTSASISTALLTILTAASAASQVPPNLNAKVAETLMGPRTPRTVMSEDGDHIAIVTAKGSRQVVLIDGVEGPVFDEIPTNHGWTSERGSVGTIVFSPTGGRSAYIARRGGDFIAVVDGKEAVTLSTPATQQGASYSDPAGWNFYFSRDGSRLAYAALGGPASWVMVADGVKGPPYRAFHLQQTALNAKRLAYVAQTPDLLWHVVVDGKQGPGYAEISSLKLTPDGAHYAFIANKGNLSVGLVVADGVEGPAYPGGVSELDLAPDGRVAYLATKPQTGPGGNPPHLMVGGLDIPNPRAFGGTLRVTPQHYVTWSADGKRFGYIQGNTPNPGVTVMVNGKAMGPAYQAAGELVWSPDGSRFAYVGKSPSGTFPVVDGQELSAYNWIKDFKFSPDGSRYAFYGANSTGIWMVVDGKEQPKALGFSDGSLRFSPAGNHIAYGAQVTVTNYGPVVDGVAKPHNLGTFATKIPGNPYMLMPIFAYSPDGNHLAYVGAKNDGTGKFVVWVDGVAQFGPLPSYFDPAWSPDSKHFAAVASNGSGKGWAIMVDGKMSPSYEDLVLLNVASARFTDGHTYRFYAVKGTDVYRVTLDVP